MKLTAEQSASKIREQQDKLDEYEQLFEAIKAGEVDAFALSTNSESEIFTLRAVDYAYRVLVENFNEGALNLSEEGIIVYTNKYFPELLNLPYEDVIGKLFCQFIHPETKDEFNELFSNGLISKAKGEINLFISNSTIPVYVSLTSLLPNIESVGMIITDLTERKREEEMLRIKNAELVRRNNELEAFAHIASHDLQSPLRKIQVFISRVLKTEKDKLSENGKDYLNRVKYAANAMQVLVHDLIDYAQANKTDRKFEYTELSQIVNEVKSDLEDEINEKQAILEAKDLNMVYIIPFQFRQLMHNLIGNSLKFFYPGAPPHIVVKSEIAFGHEFNNVNICQEKEYCRISVSDNGIGFDPEYSDKIFELFHRLNPEGKFKGTGIGLAIVKKVVDNHGGFISVVSELNKGATFSIFIPLSQQD